MSFEPTEQSFRCSVCNGSVTVTVPYCHLPELPSGWTLVRVTVGDGTGPDFFEYVHVEHAADFIRASADNLTLV